MKCEIIIDENSDEKVIIYAKAHTPEIAQIQHLAEQTHAELLGYRDQKIVRLNPAQLDCISIIGGKVFAISGKEHWNLKQRLYALETQLPETFVKINQSCMANISRIGSFDASISGTLRVHFKSGHIDYVSRRQLKHVKERLGIL